MKTFKIALPAVLLAAGFLICTTTSYSKPEYAKKEKKACTYCHVKMGVKDLNDVGKCYQTAKYSLEKCEPKK
jgi:hypothetical protein